MKPMPNLMFRGWVVWLGGLAWHRPGPMASAIILPHYLLRRNIKIIRPSDKLDYKKFGPFKIKRNIKNISYELYCLFIIRIYPVFYISLLELADLNTPIKPVPEIYFNI
jgi:hypothetical protein